MIALRSGSGAVGQAAISSSVRPQPVHMPRETLQMLRQGEGTELAASCVIKSLWRLHLAIGSGQGMCGILRRAGLKGDCGMKFEIGRRRLIASLGLAAAAPVWSQQARTPPRLPGYPFTLGVAAGDPDSTGFVIWTRLAPVPGAPLSGLDPFAYPVRWEIADDEGFARTLFSGEALARPELGHSVHVTVAGLEPGRPYHYRFRIGDAVSAVGRARTLPTAGADVRQVRLGVAGCQDYQAGLYTAFADIAKSDLDAVFHYGDYMYEGGPVASRANWSTGALEANVRLHDAPMAFSLDDYRRRYSLIRRDTDLQAAHASAAFLCSFDDHEAVNNWVGDHAGDVPPEIFRLRRASAMQAWYEFMPVRADALPVNGLSGPWRQYRYGRLLDARLLNTRNWRSDQPCGDKFGSFCPEVNRADAEVIGRAQEDWLVRGLGQQPARWNALLQQIMMMDLDRARADTRTINPDSWGGYAVPRDRLLNRLKGVPNLVVLTGDEHQHFAGEVRPTGAAPETAARAVEFVTTSVSSGSDGPGERKEHAEVLRRNPGLKYVRDERGWTLMTVTPDGWQADMRVIDTVRRTGGKASIAASWRVPAGTARLERA
jgi:alkaline phosphatase D